jgi:hypothetical protein
LDETFIVQSFGRAIQQFQPSGLEFIVDPKEFGPAFCRIKTSCVNISSDESIDLVFHESDKWRHYDRDSAISWTADVGLFVQLREGYGRDLASQQISSLHHRLDVPSAASDSYGLNEMQ